MPGHVNGRTQGVPRLAARRNWKRYVAGMATEVVYVLVLAAAAFLSAVIAWMVTR